MDNTLLINQGSFYEEKIEANLMPEQSCSLSKEKTVRRNKKDNLRQKKRLKKTQKQIIAENNKSNNRNLSKSKSDQDNSTTTLQSKTMKSKCTSSSSVNNNNFNLNLILNKTPYVSVTNSNKISGDFGHSSAIFKRPIIEGVYFLELVIKQDHKQDKKVNYKSAVRVGICHHAYNPSFPLGCDQSIAYKSCDGSVVRNGQKIGQGQPYDIGDVIGMLMRISPPHKVPNPKEINQDSTISFFKNGRLMFELKQLKQIFYCFGISFFNYSQVDILTGTKSKYLMCQDAKQYFNVLNQPILYKDLTNNTIFKI